jgi:hypothetical protein
VKEVLNVEHTLCVTSHREIDMSIKPIECMWVYCAGNKAQFVMKDFDAARRLLRMYTDKVFLLRRINPAEDGINGYNVIIPHDGTEVEVGTLVHAVVGNPQGE